MPKENPFGIKKILSKKEIALKKAKIALAKTGYKKEKKQQEEEKIIKDPNFETLHSVLSGMQGEGGNKEDLMYRNRYGTTGGKKVYRSEKMDPYTSSFIENLPDTKGLESFLENFELNPLQEAEMEAMGVISENPELSVVEQERRREKAVFEKAKELRMENEELPFEDRDILKGQILEARGYGSALEEKIAEMKAKKLVQAKKEQEQINKTPFEKQNILEYSAFEFKSMQDAFRFKTFLDKFPMVEQKRPKDAGGKSLTDNEIEGLLKKYYERKDNTRKGISKPEDYSTEELRLMKESAEWNSFAKEYKKTKKQEKPTFADGKEMTIEEMNELAKEYEELEQKDPLTFAELKFQIGEWGKGKFEWKEGTYKGEDQYTSILKENGITKKFIVRKSDLPGDFKLKKWGMINFYSILSYFEAPGGKTTLFFIKLMKPYNVEAEEQKKKLIYSAAPDRKN